MRHQHGEGVREAAEAVEEERLRRDAEGGVEGEVVSGFGFVVVVVETKPAEESASSESASSESASSPSPVTALAIAVTLVISVMARTAQGPLVPLPSFNSIIASVFVVVTNVGGSKLPRARHQSGRW